ncbi:MAG: NifB/NifX family molybdenum-iron cluster-binding protein [Pirellulales bacterium]|nr:NifB/NifX family molybdenum-iron cluster-binding protein [Pirellulales bacterium]
MKLAIPTFNTRVSPRFDCAQSILLVTVDDGKESKRQAITFNNWAPHERINRLLELGVDKVLCGGIDRWSVASLQSAGVTIYGWVTGEVEDAIEDFLQGNLDAETAVSSCRCRRFPGDDNAGAKPPGPGQGMRGRRGRGGRRRRGSGGQQDS